MSTTDKYLLRNMGADFNAEGDFLRTSFESLLAKLKKRDIVTMNGRLLVDDKKTSIPIIRYGYSGREGWERFADEIISLGCKLILVESDTLDEEDLHEALDTLRKMAKDTEERRVLEAKIESCQAKIGCLSAYRITAILPSPPVRIIITDHADWWSYVEDIELLAESLEPSDEEEEPNESDIEMKKNEEIAERIGRIAASDSRMHDAKNWSDRGFIVKSIVKNQNIKIDERYVFDAVVSKASSIYKTEVVPMIRTKATDMISSGGKIDAIAKQLSVPERVLKTILGKR